MIDHTIFSSHKALFHTFGCKLNFAETSTVARTLAEHGIMRCQRGDMPDIVVINTCSVTELADKKCRQTIRSYARRYPDAAIVVTGCYAQLKSSEVAALPSVAVVAGNDRKGELAAYIEQWLATRSPATMGTPHKDIRTFTPSCSRGDRTRYFLKVQDGCDYFCSYCTIPMARGRSRSDTIDNLVKQSYQAAKEGGKEIVITGVNIGDFGKGRSDTFFDLIRALDQVDGIERYRISSIEPDLLTDEMIEWVAQSRAFMPHFHIPLQSGSDTILELMRRHYRTDLFRHKVEAIREAMPHAFIGVDLIVGARGETADLYKQSHDFVESLDISRLHVFPYSERPGTRALNIDHIVDQHDKHLRTREMIAISERKLDAFASQFVGDVRPVLVEHRDKDGMMSGFTDNYIRVQIPADSSLANTVVPVRLTQWQGELMKGEIVS